MYVCTQAHYRMGLTGCVVPNCAPDKRDLCKKWIRIINNVERLHLDPSVVYKKYRVSYKHFLMEDHTTSNRLKKEAYPKLYIPSS